MSAVFKEALVCFLDGLSDSVKMQKLYGMGLFSSKSLGPMVAHNLFFFFSYALYVLWIIPFIKSTLDSASPSFFRTLFSFLYGSPHSLFLICWLVPAWLYTVFANAVWHGAIAEDMMHPKQQPQQKKKSGNEDAALGEMLYKVVLYNAMLIVAFVSGFFPFIGSLAQATLYAWLYAVYAFEFKWKDQGWGILQCIDFFELRWVYFVGFGTPLTVLAYSQVSLFTSYPITSIFMPFFCATALYGEPTRQEHVPRLRLRGLAEMTLLKPFVSRLRDMRKARREKRQQQPTDEMLSSPMSSMSSSTHSNASSEDQ